jgi:hypothetical protein
MSSFRYDYGNMDPTGDNRSDLDLGYSRIDHLKPTHASASGRSVCNVHSIVKEPILFRSMITKYSFFVINPLGVTVVGVCS